MLENRDDGANPRHIVENDASNRSLMVWMMIGVLFCGLRRSIVDGILSMTFAGRAAGGEDTIQHPCLDAFNVCMRLPNAPGR